MKTVLVKIVRVKELYIVISQKFLDFFGHHIKYWLKCFHKNILNIIKTIGEFQERLLYFGGHEKVFLYIIRQIYFLIFYKTL